MPYPASLNGNSCAQQQHLSRHGIPACQQTGSVARTHHHQTAFCRPMGTALLLAAVDKQGPQLYLIEPSGTGLVRCRAPCCNSSVIHYMAADMRLKPSSSGCTTVMGPAFWHAEVLWHSGWKGAAGSQDRDRAAQAGRAHMSPGRHGGRQDVSV